MLCYDFKVYLCTKINLFYSILLCQLLQHRFFKCYFNLTLIGGKLLLNPKLRILVLEVKVINGANQTTFK